MNYEFEFSFQKSKLLESPARSSKADFEVYYMYEHCKMNKKVFLIIKIVWHNKKIKNDFKKFFKMQKITSLKISCFPSENRPE